LLLLSLKQTNKQKAPHIALVRKMTVFGIKTILDGISSGFDIAGGKNDCGNTAIETHQNEGWRRGSSGRDLPSKCETLSSNLITTNTKNLQKPNFLQINKNPPK
jgi:hypothetical protein